MAIPQSLLGECQISDSTQYVVQNIYHRTSIQRKKSLGLTQEFFNYLILSCWVGAARLILCFRVKCIPNGHVLKHYHFPNVFLCQIKKVYIFFVTPESFEYVQQWLLGVVPTPPTCNAIRHACRRRGVNMDMHFCRKIHSL